jgi:hypothetical protein
MLILYRRSKTCNKNYLLLVFQTGLNLPQKNKSTCTPVDEETVTIRMRAISMKTGLLSDTEKE